MKRQDIIKAVAAIVLISAIIYYIYQDGYFAVIAHVKISEFLLLVLLTLFNYFVFGGQLFYVVKKQNNITLKVSDILFLPISMSLFGYIIPTNGGLLYSAFFLKRKYQIDSSKGFSIGIFSVYISFIITGILGIVLCLVSETINYWLLLVSCALIFLPYIVPLCNTCLQKFQAKPGSFLKKAQTYIHEIIVQSHKLMLDKTTLSVNILINMVYLVIAFVSYHWLNRVLDLGMPLTSVFIILLITRISSLIRILPGNLGLEELSTAGIFTLLSQDPAIGIIFSLLLRVSTIVVFIPIGIIHTACNIDFLRIKELFKKAAAQKNVAAESSRP